MQLKSLITLNDPRRLIAIDFYRGIALLAVVFFHFDTILTYGYLGVDLFFVISGFLVGRILIEKYRKGEILYWDFILQRGFKIWPSFYCFLIIGNTIAYFLYQKTNPETYIPLHDLPRYLFFYRNFTGIPEHWNFDHIWSLCVEEHFYILFPIVLIILLHVGNKTVRNLYFICFLTILAGFVFKILALYLSHGKDTDVASYNRIDALAYGALLYLITDHFKNKAIIQFRLFITLIGVLFLISLIYSDSHFHNYFYQKVVFPSLAPLCFSMMIFGSYNFKFKYIFPIRFLSYYSYNFYLWHTLLIYFIYNKFGHTISALIIYLIGSFSLAFITTIVIEEYFLNRRKIWIKRLLDLLKRH